MEHIPWNRTKIQGYRWIIIIRKKNEKSKTWELLYFSLYFRNNGL